MTSETEPTTPGERLKRQREKLGLRLVDVAERARVSTPFVSMLETGYQPRRRRTSLERVASAVEMDAEEIWPTKEATA